MNKFILILTSVVHSFITLYDPSSQNTYLGTNYTTSRLLLQWSRNLKLHIYLFQLEISPPNFTICVSIRRDHNLMKHIYTHICVLLIIQAIFMTPHIYVNRYELVKGLFWLSCLWFGWNSIHYTFARLVLSYGSLIHLNLL